MCNVARCHRPADGPEGLCMRCAGDRVCCAGHRALARQQIEEDDERNNDDT